MISDLSTFLIGAAFNLATALLIVRGIYYPATRTKSYVFSFLVFNTVIFAVLSLLNNVELSIGVGFGLFAIFSVLNYRTDEMPIREMTYLFGLIALPVMNAFLMTGSNLPQVAAANALVVGLMFVLEKGWGFRFESTHKLAYDRVDLLAPARSEELLADLHERLGLPVKRVSIGRIDLVKDTADIVIHYDPRPETAPVSLKAAATVTRVQAEAA
jgi:hypothetical protein